MDITARNEMGESSKRRRSTGTPEGGSEAMEMSSAPFGEPTFPAEHNKYIPNCQGHENNLVFHDKNDNNIAVQLVRGAVLPGDRAHVNSLNPDVVASQLMQGIAQLPALVDKLTQDCVQSRRNIKSLEAALEIEKAERERWENLYKDLYSKMRIEQSEKEEASLKIPESEREPDPMQKDTEVDVQSEKEEYLIKILKLEREKEEAHIKILELVREKEEAHIKILELEREKEGANRIPELERELDAMQKNIKLLEEKLELMKNLKDGNDMKIRELNEKVHDLEIKNKKLTVQYHPSDKIRKLNEKVHDLEIENQKLIVQYHLSNKELAHARTALMESALKDLDKNQRIYKLEVMKDRPGKDVIAFKQKMKELNKELELIAELHDAHKELMLGMSDILSGSNVNFRVKRMGELDVEIFMNSCKLKFPPENAESKALELRLFWQKQLNNPKWKPFEITVDKNGNTRELLKEDDKLLLNLKQVWGDEIYNAVTKTLKDLIDCNSIEELLACNITRDRNPVPVLWNSKEDRKATLGEVIRYMCSELESLRSKRS